MNEDRAKALGELLQERRKQLGYSTYQVANAAGVSESTVVRFEQGRFRAPRPDKLVRFARLLDISLADLFAKVGYLMPEELPTFSAYLAAKYPALPTQAILELTRHFKEIRSRYQSPSHERPNLSTRKSDETSDAA